MNVVVLKGRLVRDVELRRTQSGVAVASFTLAVDRRFKNEAGERQADFINCVAWRNTAEFVAEYFCKGKEMAVSGRLETRNYEDKNGNKRTAYEINVSDVDFCGSKSEQRSEEDVAPVSFEAVEDDAEGLPF